MGQNKQRYIASPILPCGTIVRYVLQKKVMYWWFDVSDEFNKRITGQEEEIKQLATELNRALSLKP